MANIGYFEIPADNVDRAKHFYRSLLGWKIEPTATPMDPAAAPMQYQDIITGKPEDGTMHMGGLYKRQMQEPIINYVIVDDIDKVLAEGGETGRQDWRTEKGDKNRRGHRDYPGHRRKRHRPLEAGEEVVPSGRSPWATLLFSHPG